MPVVRDGGAPQEPTRRGGAAIPYPAAEEEPRAPEQDVKGGRPGTRRRDAPDASVPIVARAGASAEIAPRLNRFLGRLGVWDRGLYQDEPSSWDEAVRYEPTGTTPYVMRAGRTYEMTAEELADRMAYDAYRSLEIYKSTSPDALYQAPDTTVWTAIVNNDAVTTAVMDDLIQFYARVYGSEAFGAYVAAELLEDPVQREETLRALRIITGYEPPSESGMSMAFGTPSFEELVVGEPGAPGPAPDPQAIITRVLEQRSAEGLTDQELAAARGLAGEIIAGLELLPDTGVSGDFKRAYAVGITQDWTLALSPEDAELIDQVFGLIEEQPGGFTAETPELAQVGIEQVQHKGEGVVVLDEEWARENPDRAYALKMYIEQQNPAIEVSFGRQGAAGSILDKLGMAVDYITAPTIGAVGAIAELTDRIALSPEERQRLSQEADRLEAQLEQTPPEQVEETLRAIAHYRDLAEDDFNWERYLDDLHRTTSPRMAGFGAADTIMRAANMYPGDTGYGFAYALTGLIVNLIADPLTYAGPIYGGWKAARTIPIVGGPLGTVDEIAESLKLRLPGATLQTRQAAARELLKLAGDRGYIVPEVGQGYIKNMTYAALARTPEEFLTLKPFRLSRQRYWRLREVLGEEEFASLLMRGGLDKSQARYLAHTQNFADMDWAMLRVMTGHRWEAFDVDELMRRRNAAAERVFPGRVPGSEPALHLGERGEDVIRAPLTPDEYRAAIGDYFWLDDTIKGRDWVNPMTNFITRKQLRRLERVGGKPYGVYGKVLSTMTDLAEEFPANVFRLWGPEVEGRTRIGFMRARNMYASSGAGKVLSFPSTSVAARALKHQNIDILSKDESFQAIWDFGRLMSIPDARMRELMAPWASGKLATNADSFEWWKQTWQTMVDESPLLTAAGRDDWRQMWHSYGSERSPGYIVTMVTDADGTQIPTHVPTLFARRIVDGEEAIYGIPAIEADQFQAWKLPDIKDARDHLAMGARTMRDWGNLDPSLRKGISTAHLALAQSWVHINSFWRSAVLGFRLIGGLPLRIFSEQMLRMAAYDYASAVYHPAEWFASTKWGVRLSRAGDTALFTDSPRNMLGTFVDDMLDHPSWRQIRAGRTEVTPIDGAAYWRSYSDRLTRFGISHSTREWLLPYLGDPGTAVQVMRADKWTGREWLDLFAAPKVDMDPTVAVRRIMTELEQLIGTGPGSDIVRTLISEGRVVHGEKIYRLGTREVADLLKDLKTQGWQSGATYLARSAGDYIPADRIGALARVRDLVFRIGYSAPDLAASRSPLFRQIARRKFRNLVAIGYDPGKARELAAAHAARATADMMFTIGAKTPGEFFLRNLMPFFPAYRELADTWLLRIPQRLGEGSHLLGWATLARRADIWMDFFKNIGLVREDRDGRMVTPAGVFAPLIAAVTGTEAEEWQAGIPLESAVGILPVPFGLFAEDENGEPLPWAERLKGVLPSLGAPASTVLWGINKLFNDALKGAEDWLTMFGADQSLGPASLDRFLEAFGITGPWMVGGTADYHESLKTWAVIDGLRLAWDEFPPPDFASFDADGDGDLSPQEREAYAGAYKTWAEKILHEGEKYGTNMYLLRALMGSALPFSVRMEDEGKTKMAALWGLLNRLPDEAGGETLHSLILDGVLAEYPKLAPYMTGKNLDTRVVDDPDETLDEFMQAVKDGAVVPRSPQDWLIFANGMNSYSIYQSRVAAIYEEFTTSGASEADWLVQFDAKDALDAEREAWRDFVAASEAPENMLPGQTQSFSDMFSRYQNYKALRDGDQPRTSIEQEQLLEFGQLMKEYAKYFSPNPESADEYYKLRDKAFAAIEGAGGSPLSRAVGWWFDEVADPYWSKRDEIYKELEQMSQTDPRRGLLYDDLRKLADRLYRQRIVNGENPEWGRWISPEVYVFEKLNRREQRVQVAEWASLPPTWLTQFQREQVGYRIPKGRQDDASRLSALVAQGEVEFDQWIEKEHTSPNSKDALAKRAELDASYARYAKEHGLEGYWRYINQPAYQRVGDALGLGERSALWNQAAAVADSYRRQIEAEGYSPGGSSFIAETAHKWLTREIVEEERAGRKAREEGRENARTAFLDILNELRDAYQLTNTYDLVRAVFFDYYFD